MNPFDGSLMDLSNNVIGNLFCDIPLKLPYQCSSSLRKVLAWVLHVTDHRNESSDVYISVRDVSTNNQS